MFGTKHQTHTSEWDFFFGFGLKCRLQQGIFYLFLYKNTAYIDQAINQTKNEKKTKTKKNRIKQKNKNKYIQKREFHFAPDDF